MSEGRFTVETPNGVEVTLHPLAGLPRTGPDATVAFLKVDGTKAGGHVVITVPLTLENLKHLRQVATVALAISSPPLRSQEST